MDKAPQNASLAYSAGSKPQPSTLNRTLLILFRVSIAAVVGIFLFWTYIATVNSADDSTGLGGIVFIGAVYFALLWGLPALAIAGLFFLAYLKTKPTLPRAPEETPASEQ